MTQISRKRKNTDHLPEFTKILHHTLLRLTFAADRIRMLHICRIQLFYNSDSSPEKPVSNHYDIATPRHRIFAFHPRESISAPLSPRPAQIDTGRASHESVVASVAARPVLSYALWTNCMLPRCRVSVESTWKFAS